MELVMLCRRIRGALVTGKNLKDSILAGHALACACVQQVSCRAPKVDKHLNQRYNRVIFDRLDRNTHGKD